jgi:predicted nucleic-acid-binding protein
MGNNLSNVVQGVADHGDIKGQIDDALVQLSNLLDAVPADRLKEEHRDKYNLLKSSYFSVISRITEYHMEYVGDFRALKQILNLPPTQMSDVQKTEAFIEMFIRDVDAQGLSLLQRSFRAQKESLREIVLTLRYLKEFQVDLKDSHYDSLRSVSKLRAVVGGALLAIGIVLMVIPVTIGVDKFVAAGLIGGGLTVFLPGAYHVLKGIIDGIDHEAAMAEFEKIVDLIQSSLGDIHVASQSYHDFSAVVDVLGKRFNGKHLIVKNLMDMCDSFEDIISIINSVLSKVSRKKGLLASLSDSINNDTAVNTLGNVAVSSVVLGLLAPELNAT